MLMSKSKQLFFIPKQKLKKEHGGSLAIGKRRAKRPLNLKLSHHVTLKSHYAIGARSLFRHKKFIQGLIKKNSLRFEVKVYECAIQGNHIHLLVKAKTREGLQNFFRVVAGHSAQRILKDYPLKLEAGGARSTEGKQIQKALGAEKKRGHQTLECRKNQRKFWSYLLYSRVVSWGQEFKTVIGYIQKNTMELLQIIAYEPRLNRTRINSG